MPHSLSVTVHVDVDLRTVTLAITGCLTTETHVALLPIIAQARHLDPCPRLTIDLQSAGHVDPDALTPLRHGIAADLRNGHDQPALLLPDPLPVCDRTVPTLPIEWTGTTVAGQIAGEDSTRSDGAPPLSTPARTRKDEVLEGAAEMFAEHGYYGASLRDIGRRIGISHTGLMHHFASKDALLAGVIDLLEDHAQAALEQLDAMRTAPEALQSRLSTYWHPGELPLQLLATLSTESVSGDHPGRFRVARLRRVHEHIFEQCFSAFDGMGLLRPGLEPAFAGRALFGLLLSLAVRERTVRALQQAPHGDAPLEELDRMIRSFLQVRSGS